MNETTVIKSYVIGPQINYGSYAINATNIPEPVTILQEGPQICPLCKSMLKLYYINFNEKVLMCENTECEYPFGHDDVKFYKDHNDFHSVDETLSINSFITPSVAASTVSSSAWADIEQMNKVYESEDQFDVKSMNEFKDKNIIQQVEKESEEQLLKNVQNIKELNTALSETNDQKVQCISNEKWIKNLMNIQQMSGMKLLRKGEMEKLKKKELILGSRELKIDIDSSKSNISSITIEIAN